MGKWLSHEKYLITNLSEPIKVIMYLNLCFYVF